MKDLPCRATLDELSYDRWDEFDEDEEQMEMQRTIHDITLADLMGEEFDVFVGKNTKSGFVMDLDFENGSTSTEKCINPAAMESLAHFCRSFLRQYDKIEEVE